MTEKSVPDSEYDIIVAGGGTCGCLIAGRLASHPFLRILILEAGPPTRDELKHIQPGRYVHNLTANSDVIKYYAGQPSEALAGRTPLVPTGHCLGGGSSVNLMMYTRASASDYDEWETAHQNPGWGSKDLTPLLRKVETYQADPNAETHGSSGPIKVSSGGVCSNVAQQFLDVAREWDSGTERVVEEDVDSNDLSRVNVYCRWQKWIDGQSGRRSDVPHHFIYNQSQNQNLHIVTGVHIKRILFDSNGRASAVEFQWNPAVRPDADPASTQVVYATKQIVLSAGAFGSPTILERSGIGAHRILEKNGVTPAFGPKYELPGVGQNYQDHHFLFSPYKAAPEAETLDAIVRGDEEALAQASKQWLETGQGPLASNGIDAGIKFRPSHREVEEIGPEFKSRWDQHFANAPDRPAFILAPDSLFLGDPALVPPGKYYCMEFFTTYPMSIGHVHITSPDDPTAPIKFRSGFLEDKADVQLLVWAYKLSRELARRMPIFRGEIEGMHPNFAGSEARVAADAEIAFGMDEPRMKYTEEDDVAIEEFVRRNAATTWHSLGTCAMKPREHNGVVDSRLNVYGTKDLKVADMSICPSNVGSNTYSTALVIAEKAALLIAEDLGLDI